MMECRDLEGWQVRNCCEVCHDGLTQMIAIQLVDSRRINVCCHALGDAVRQLDIDDEATLALMEERDRLSHR
jgi:hypothetical protein